ncbi:hypothetical protein D3C76_1041010 [compost metagenome]
MTFQHFLGFPFQRLNRLAHKLFSCCSYILYRAAYLDNCNSVSGYRHPLLRINLRCHYIKLMGQKRHKFSFLKNRPNKSTAATYNFYFSTGVILGNVTVPEKRSSNDHCFIRTYRFVSRPECQTQHNDNRDNNARNQHSFRHKFQSNHLLTN